MSDNKQFERIKETFGNWALMQENEEAMKIFNGIPNAKTTDEKENTPHIIVPDSVIESGKELQKWERVYEIKQIGPDFFRHWTDSGFKEPDNIPDVKIGDLVICKGSVMKLFTAPASFAINLSHLVAKVGHVDKDGEIYI